ncbi:MAG: class I fructose-bisphosphate aldolase, partial [Pseudomonadota bacterium]
ASDYSGDEEMFAEMQKMRARIIQSPDFTGDRVIGAILFEKTLHETIGDTPVAEYIWNARRVVPFLKIDKGLEDEAQGVQLLKPMPGLADRLAEARAMGVFGTKERSVIQSANADGIKAIADDQFAVAHDVMAAGLVPIIEPEINIHSDTKAACEDLLADALMAHIEQLSPGQEVILK